MTDERELIEKLRREGSSTLVYGEQIIRARELANEAADALQSLSERIAVLEARQHGGENGVAGDALDYALGHFTNANKAIGFLDDWRDGRDLEARWPGYVRWLAVQRAGAAEAASLIKEGSHAK